MYVEDLKRGTNKDIGPKDIFEMGPNKVYRSGLFANTGPKCCAASLSTILVFEPSFDLDQTVEGGVKINRVAKEPFKAFLSWYLEIDTRVYRFLKEGPWRARSSGLDQRTPRRREGQ